MSLLDQMTQLGRQVRAASPAQKREIDQLVYTLCGRTPEEIKIVEGVSK